MTGQFQGWDKNLSLQESLQDRDIINNLANSPIGDDIGLFVNNNRNVSELIVESDNVVGDTLEFSSLTPFVYTSGTEITVDSIPYTVTNSRRDLTTGTQRFQLLDDTDTLVVSPPVGIYTRADNITHQNVTNLRPLIKLAVEDVTLSNIIEIQEADRNPYISVGKALEAAVGGYSDVVAGISEIDEQVNLLYNNYVNGIFIDKDVNTTRDIVFYGALSVSDPDGLNLPDQELSDENPGIYISNPADGGTRRIFSSNDNVWSEQTPDLVCGSREIVVGSLVFEENIKFTSNNANFLQAEPGLADRDFTHFIRTLINGEEFSLCLVREPTV